MSRIFLSADIEGTAGIAHWDETEKGKIGYDHFAAQMTKEVAAACEGAVAAGAEEILIKDAHDSARNIDPEALPECVRIFRGWGRDPYSMMSGLTREFDGVLFTGYHSAAGMDTNPLSHTMNTQIREIRINDMVTSELFMNSLMASYFGVPVRFLSGDEGLCNWMHEVCPGTVTVPVSKGVGNGSVSIHPALAVKKIRAGVEEAMALPAESCMFPLPETFHAEVFFKQHYQARRAGFYPGATQTGPYSVSFDSTDYFQVATFFSFVL